MCREYKQTKMYICVYIYIRNKGVDKELKQIYLELNFPFNNNNNNGKKNTIACDPLFYFFISSSGRRRKKD